MRKALSFVLVLAVINIGKASAQSMGSDYQTAVGVKFWPGALTIEHFIQDNSALEGIANFWDHGFRFTGLYELHGDVSSGAPGLKWYVGPGAHIGWYNGGWSHGDYYYRDGGFSLGVDGILGLDYKISGAPIAVSLDINPFLELASHTYVDVWGGLGVKYTF